MGGFLVAWEAVMTMAILKLRSKFTACAAVLACTVVLSVAAHARGGGGHGGGGGGVAVAFTAAVASMVVAAAGFVVAASTSAAGTSVEDTSVAVARSPRDLILPRTQAIRSRAVRLRGRASMAAVRSASDRSRCITHASTPSTTLAPRWVQPRRSAPQRLRRGMSP